MLNTKGFATIVLGFLFSINYYFAQDFNFALQKGLTNPNSMVSINKKTFFLYSSQGVPGCCMFNTFLQGRDENGNLITDKLLITEQGRDYGKLWVTADKALLLYAGTRLKSCDTGGPRYKVAKLDTNGTLLWSFSILKSINFIVPRPDGSFLIVIGDSLCRYSSAGLRLSQHSLGLGGALNSLCLMSNKQLMLNLTVGNFVRFRTIDTLGVIQSEVVMNPACSEILQSANGDFYGLSSGSLLKFSPSLSLTANSSTTMPNGTTINKFDFVNDTMYCVTSNTAGAANYFVLDNNFNSLYQSPPSIVGQVLRDITYSKVDHRSRILGLGFYAGGSNHTMASYFQMSKFGNFTAGRDVGVVKTDVYQSYMNIYSYYPNPLLFFQPTVYCQATVKNFGADTVKNFNLNYYSFRGGIFPCYLGICQNFSATIAPGATVAVQTDTFSLQYFRQDMLQADGSYSTSVCLFTSAPDKLNDDEFFNNGACGGILFESLSIDDVTVNNSLKVFPNPSDGKVEIQSSSVITNIDVLDLDGKKKSDDSL